MWKFLFLLGGTITLRPYVFIFLGAYLLLATLQLGAARTFAFLVLGYLISWAAELCSIHFGFPFGEYLYIPATLDRELWVAGVPFMDSLSYVFLAYASYCLAVTALSPGRGCQIQADRARQRPWRTLVLAAVLMVALDMVIDPVALRGYDWFLGQIYGYPEGGVYFGVTLSNFAGWFLVALVLIRVLQYLISGPGPSRFWDWGRRRLLPSTLLGSGLYLGILGFNLAMTFLIGEPLIGLVGVCFYLPFLSWLALKLLPKAQK